MAKVAVVTGGSSGIGAAVARRLAERGWSLVLLARGRERLERTAADVGAEAVQCDVADRHDVERAAAQVGERHPAVHLLVNNAGIPARGGFLDTPPERIDEVMRVNYLGGVWCARAFLPLLEAAAPSDLVNVASVAGTVAFGPSGPYAASKHAQLAFSRAVAAEFAPHGVRVHAVNPGFTQTDGFPQDRLLGRPLMRRLVLEPDQVADTILRAVDRGSPELVVPRSFRVPAVLQALAPATLTRVLSHRAARR
jgi:NAD(P)-dependent dehydrogenase (short-subunit alcohol dehydrogenase family)